MREVNPLMRKVIARLQVREVKLGVHEVEWLMREAISYMYEVVFGHLCVRPKSKCTRLWAYAPGGSRGVKIFKGQTEVGPWLFSLFFFNQTPSPPPLMP